MDIVASPKQGLYSVPFCPERGRAPRWAPAGSGTSSGPPEAPEGLTREIGDSDAPRPGRQISPRSRETLNKKLGIVLSLRQGQKYGRQCTARPEACWPPAVVHLPRPVGLKCEARRQKGSGWIHLRDLLRWQSIGMPEGALAPRRAGGRPLGTHAESAVSAGTGPWRRA